MRYFSSKNLTIFLISLWLLFGLSMVLTHFWIFELFSHFLIHLVFVTGLTYLFIFFKFRKKLALLPTVAVLFIFLLDGKGLSQKSSSGVKVISFNILGTNKNKKQVAEFLLKEVKGQHKVIVLILEYNQQWADSLSALDHYLPFKKLNPRPGNFGYGIWTNIEDAHIENKVFSSKNIAIDYAQLRFTHEGKPTVFLGIHSLPPTSPIWHQQRNDMFEHLAKNYVSKENVILAGDFNCTPWNTEFRRRFKKMSRFPASNLTGQTWGPMGISFLGLPIDFVMVSDGLKFTDYRRASHLGSDHRPLIVEIM